MRRGAMEMLKNALDRGKRYVEMDVVTPLRRMSKDGVKLELPPGGDDSQEILDRCMRRLESLPDRKKDEANPIQVANIMSAFIFLLACCFVTLLVNLMEVYTGLLQQRRRRRVTDAVVWITIDPTPLRQMKR